jgi:hypothetical protein
MLALKLPLAGLIYIVWWAIKQEPEDATNPDDDGGIKRHERPHPRRPSPRRPRRGPHGDPPPAAPARVRTARARARTLEH